MADNQSMAPESSTGPQPAESSYLDDAKGANTPADGSPAPASADANVTPDSSPDTGAKPESDTKTPLEVVQAAMEQNKGGESPPQQSVPDKPGDKAEATPDSGEPKADEPKPDDKELPFHNHPRWKEVLTENKTLKEKAAEFEALQEPAERYNKLNTFLVDNDLSGQDFSNMLNIGMAMKTAPDKALEMLEPYYNALLRMNGKIIPEDIQDKIDQGVIDEATAKTMAVERARNTHYQSQLDLERQKNANLQQRTQQEREDAARQAQVQGLTEAVTKWENTWQSSDPDYAKLMPFVRDRLATKLQQTPPTNPDDAVKLAEDAKKEVMATMGQMTPKAAMNTVPDAVTTNRSPNATPKTGLEAVQNALAAN